MAEQVVPSVSQTAGPPEVEAQTVEPFPSLDALMTAHGVLLQQETQGQEVLDAQFCTKVKEFINRGTQTGTRLDDTDERRTAQSLLNYWVTVLYRIDKEPPPDAILAYYTPPPERGFDESQCPYVGLSPFREEDKDLFFGRDSLINVIVRRLQNHHSVVLVGPAGGGKTSVLKAGVLPRLKNDPELESREWTYFASFTPGSEPLTSLASVINDDVKQTAEKLFKDPAYLRELLNDSQFGGKPCVLVIDQFEELFTFCKDDTRRKAFLDALFSLKESEIRHRLIFSMRSDQVNQLIRRPDLNDLFREAEVRLYPMKEAELHAVIKKPAERIGLKFQPGLIEQLLREIYGDPIGLPLLQFVLLELWSQRECETIPWAAMTRLGSCRDALVGKADRLYASLSDEEKEVMRRIFLRMVRLSDTWEAATESVRLEDLYRAGEDRRLTNSVLMKLLQANLARISNVSCRSVNMASGEVYCELPDQISADYQFELAHQTLARYWSEAMTWFNRLRESLVVKRRLELYAGNWGILGRRERGLLDKYQLHEAQTWLKSDEAKELGYDPDVLPLVALSRKAIRREWFFRILSAVSVFVAIVIGILVLLVAQHHSLKEQTSLLLALRAEALKDKHLDQALLLNLEAMRKENSDVVVQNSLNKGLLQLLVHSPNVKFFLHGQTTNAKQIGFSEDGKSVVALDEYGQTRSWNLLTPSATPATDQNSARSEKPTRSLLSPNGRSVVLTNKQAGLVIRTAGTEHIIYSSPLDPEHARMVFSNDSSRVALMNYLIDESGGQGRTELTVWDVGSGTKLASTDVIPAENLAFSPDNKSIAITNYKGDVIRLDASNLTTLGKPLTCTGPSPGADDSREFPIAFNGDGTRLAVKCSDTRVIVWNLTNLQPLGEFPRDSSGAANLVLDNSGQHLVVGYDDGHVVIWNTDDRLPTELEKSTESTVAEVEFGQVAEMKFSKDGNKLVALPGDGPPLVWEKIQTAAKPSFRFYRELQTGLGKISTIAVDPNGNLIAGASESGTLVVWDLDQQLPGNQLNVNINGEPFAVLPNNHVFLLDRQTQQIVEFDLAESKKVKEFPLNVSSGGVNLAEFSSHVTSKNNTVLAARYLNGSVGIWDLEAGSLKRVIPVGEDRALNTSLSQNMAIDAQGRKLAVASNAKIDIWDDERSAHATIHSEGEITALAFSNDGSKLASCDEAGTTSIWDISATAKRVGSISTGLQTRLEFTPDDSGIIATSGGVVSHWKVGSDKPVFSKKLPLIDYVLHPEKSELAASLEDGSILILTLPNGEEQFRLPAHEITGSRGKLTRLLYTGESNTFLASYGGYSMNLISMDPTLWRKRGCTVANRPLTPEEANFFRAFQERMFWQGEGPLDVGCSDL